jgi:hypothetical protein
VFNAMLLNFILATSVMISSEKFRCYAEKPSVCSNVTSDYFPECDCRVAVNRSVIIDCANKTLASVPSWKRNATTPPDVEIYELMLNHNNITNITLTELEGLSVKRINLLENPLISIQFDGNTPSGFSELRMGSTKKDGAELSRDALSKLTTLTTLKVLELRNIRPADHTLPAILHTMTNLTTLIWSGGNLHTLPDNSLPPNLVTLDLSNNSITQLPTGFFDAVKNTLKNLSLAGSGLRLDTGLENVQELTHLTSLDLSNTSMGVFWYPIWTTLGKLKELRTLVMNRAGIPWIDGSQLMKMEKLTNLSLRQNNLTFLPRHIIVAAERVRNLDLSENSIYTANGCMFEDVTFPYSPNGFQTECPLFLNLSANPLICDCRLKWAQKAMAEGSIHVDTNTTCMDNTGASRMGLNQSQVCTDKRYKAFQDDCKRWAEFNVTAEVSDKLQKAQAEEEGEAMKRIIAKRENKTRIIIKRKLNATLIFILCLRRHNQNTSALNETKAQNKTDANCTVVDPDDIDFDDLGPYPDDYYYDYITEEPLYVEEENETQANETTSEGGKLSLKVGNRTKDSIQVSWEWKGNETVKLYYLMWMSMDPQNGTTGSQTQLFQPDVTSTELSGLEPGTSYKVRLGNN